MNKKEWQNKFDDVKWYDSIQAGYDKCGGYDFCASCRKSDAYPCASAAYRFRNGFIKIATVRRYRF